MMLNDCRKFRSNRMESFEKIEKKSKNGCFLAIFGLTFAIFLRSQSYELDFIVHTGAPLGVE